MVTSSKVPQPLGDVEGGGQIRQAGPEEPTQKDHGRCSGHGPRESGQGHGQGAEQGADHDGHQRGQHREPGRARAAGLQDEDRPGEAQKADAQVGPQTELIEQAKGLGNSLAEIPSDLRVGVGGYGDESGFPVMVDGRHGSPYAGIIRSGSAVDGTGARPLSPAMPELPRRYVVVTLPGAATLRQRGPAGGPDSVGLPRSCSQHQGPVAQRSEHGTHNPLVVGSIPTGPTKKPQVRGTF